MSCEAVSAKLLDDGHGPDPVTVGFGDAYCLFALASKVLLVVMGSCILALSHKGGDIGKVHPDVFVFLPMWPWTWPRVGGLTNSSFPCSAAS